MKFILTLDSIAEVSFQSVTGVDLHIQPSFYYLALYSTMVKIAFFPPPFMIENPFVDDLRMLIS